MPDAKVLLLQIRTKGVDRLGALTIATGTLRRFEQAGSNPRYVSSGYVVVATRSGTLLACRSTRRAWRSPGRRCGGRWGGSRTGWCGEDGDVPDGAFAYVTGPLALRDLVMVDRAGSAPRVAARKPPRLHRGRDLSPDGRRIAGRSG